MALKKKPVTGMKDILPAGDADPGLCAEPDQRDLPAASDSPPLRLPAWSTLRTCCSKQGGDNEKLIFKILKRGEKLNIETAETENDLADGGLRYDLTLPLIQILFQQLCQTCRRRSRRSRWAAYGVQTVRRRDVSASSSSVISIFSATPPTRRRSS